jgi:hypothetical protein
MTESASAGHPVRMEWLAEHWRERARSELSVASYSSRLVTQAIAADVPPAVVDMLARAPSDEVRHAHVCLEMSRHHGGDGAWPMDVKSEPLAVPGLSSNETTVLALVSHGCINETVANVWLERSLAVATNRKARAALRELLGDEIVHARTGWAFVGAPAFRPWRGLVAKYMTSMIRATLRVWTGPKAHVLPEGAHEHGVLSLEETRSIAREAVESLVLAGFDEAGITTARARQALSRTREAS